MDDWTLSIDVGTTATAAAVSVAGRRRVIELDGRTAMPSTVLATSDGVLIVGDAAESQAPLHPDRVERTPKRRLGDPVMLLGEQAVEPVDAIAAIIVHVAAAATAQMGGRPLGRLVLTHPAAWGSRRTAVLSDAARRAGLPEPVLVPEPVAACAHLTSDVAQPDDLLAVYDLGGGTLDLAIVRRVGETFVVAGPPGGDDSLGGEALDERVVAALLDRLEPGVRSDLATSDERAWQQARMQFRRDARGAKEALSSSAVYQWYAGTPLDTEFQLTSPELEALVREPIEATVRSLLDTIRRAGLTPATLRTVVMVGGSARAPLVGRLLAEATGRPPTTWGDPKAAVCLGALLVADSVPASAAVDTTADGSTADSLIVPAAGTAAPAAARTTAADQEVAATRAPDAAATPEAAPTATPVDALASSVGELADGPPRPREHGPGASRPDPRDAGSWTGRRIGATIAVGLMSLGVVSAILAVLAR